MTHKWRINIEHPIDGVHPEFTEEQKTRLAKMTPEERDEAKRKLYEIYKQDAENDWCKTLD